MKKITQITIIILLIFTVPVIGGEVGGDSAAIIMDLSPGGKASAMGGAFIAISDDATAVMWNPAGLYQIDGDELTLFFDGMSGFYFQSGYIGYARNISQYLTIGFGAHLLFSGEQEIIGGGIIQDIFDEKQGIIALSAGFNLPFAFKPGITLKYGFKSFSWEHLGVDRSQTANFFNFDLGVIYPMFKFLDFGLKIENVIPNVNWGYDNATEEVNTKIIFGTSVKLFDKKFNFAFDLEYVMKNSATAYHIGMEYRVLKAFSIYAGIDRGKFSCGLNYYLTDFSFYFSTLLDSNLSPSVRTALHYKIGKSKRKYKSIESQMVSLTAGLNYFSDGKYTRARKEFKKVLKENPQNDTASRLDKMAKNRLSGKEWRTKKDRDYIDNHFKKGLDLFKLKRWAVALDEFNKVIEIDPLHWRAKDFVEKIDKIVKKMVAKNLKVGVESFINDDFAKAKKYLKNVLSLKKNNKQAGDIFNRIKVIEKKRWENLRKEKLRESNAGIYFKRGLELYKRNVYIDAINSLKLSLKYVDAKTTRYYLGLAKKRLRNLKISVQSKKKSDSYLKLGNRMFVEKKLLKAINNYKKAVNYYPKNKEANVALEKAQNKLKSIVVKPYNAGVKYYKAGKYLPAIRKWKVALKLDPDYEPAKKFIKKTAVEMKQRSHYNTKMADSYYQMGSDEKIMEAMKYYKRAVELDGKNNNAKRGYQKCVKRFDKKSKILFDKGFRALKSGAADKLDEAIINFKNYLLIKPDDKQAQEFLKEAKKKRSSNATYFIVKNIRKEGIDLFNNREYAKARDKFRVVLSYRKKDKEAKRYLVKCNSRLKLTQSRNKIMSLFNNGIRSFKQRDYAKAIAIWKSVEDKPYATESDKKMIRGYIKTAVEVKKFNQNKFFVRGREFSKAGQLLKARTALREALKINKFHKKARTLIADVNDRIRGVAYSKYKKGVLHYKKGDYSKAVEVLNDGLLYDENDEKIINKKNDAEINRDFLIKAVALEKNGKLIDAILVYEKIYQNNKVDKKTEAKISDLSKKLSTRSILFIKKAEKLIDDENYRDALVTLKLVNKIIKLNPDQTSQQTVINHVRKLISKTQKAIIVRLRTNYSIGYSFYSQKKYAVALKRFNVVYALQRDYKRVRAYRRVCINSLQATRNAKNKKQNKIIQKYLYGGMNYYRQGKYRQAIAVWRKILALNPRHSAARNYIGRAKFKLGQ